jgi:hypothetical protein
VSALILGVVLFDGLAIATSMGVEDWYKWEFQQIMQGIPICIYGSELLRKFAFQRKGLGMPELSELSEQDREIAKRMWEELKGAATLKDCEDAVQVVKECRRHGIDPESIIGPGMKTFLAFERIHQY